MDTTDAELNRVLEAGVPGSMILWEENLVLVRCVYKTLNHLIELCTYLESQKQIKMRAERITTSVLYFWQKQETQNIFKQIETIQPEIVIIDSIQTLHTDYIESTAGSISQIRETTAELIKFAKRKLIFLLFWLVILPRTELLLDQNTRTHGSGFTIWRRSQIMFTILRS
jgi:DNA repair protein RadA/Sms